MDSMLISGGFLFVGLHKAGEGIIKVWNMAANVDHLLTGHKVGPLMQTSVLCILPSICAHTHTHAHKHIRSIDLRRLGAASSLIMLIWSALCAVQGAVLCMCVVGSSLVSGGQDNTIRVWNFNQAAGIFMSQAIITKDEGGHNASVLALTVVGSIMFSADRVGNILVSNGVGQKLTCWQVVGHTHTHYHHQALAVTHVINMRTYHGEERDAFIMGVPCHYMPTPLS